MSKELTKEAIREAIRKMMDDGKEDENLSVIWNKIEETPPFMVKGFSGKGGFKGTAINSQIQRRMMAKVFGDFGHGWGLDNLNIRFQTFGEEAMNSMCLGTADFWYIHPTDAEKKSFPIGADMWVFYSYWKDNKMMWRRDNDVVKKLITDMTTKGISMIGGGADVFYGMYDDSKYVMEMQNKYGGVFDDGGEAEVKKRGSMDKKKEDEKVRPVFLLSDGRLKNVLGHILDGKEYRWIIAKIVNVGYEVPSSEEQDKIGELMKKNKSELQEILRGLEEGK